MTLYTYDSLPAYDPHSGGIARNATGKVYATSDETHATPLPVQGLNGIPFTDNELTTTDDGFLPTFRVEDHLEVVWVSGPYEIPLLSMTGVIERVTEAVAQADAAREAALLSQQAAEEAASTGGGGTTTVEGLTDATPIGKAVVTADSQTEAQSAIGVQGVSLELGDGLEAVAGAGVGTLILRVAARLSKAGLDAEYVNEGAYALLQNRVAALEAANGPTPGSQYALATFTAPDGTLLPSYVSETGLSFSRVAGTPTDADLVIRAGKVYPLDHLSTVFVSSATPPSANYTVEASIEVKSVVAGTNMGVFGRWSGTGENFYVARYVADNDAYRLAKVVNGVGTLLASYPAGAAATPGKTAVVGLRMVGTTISLLVDGVVVGSQVDSTFTAAGKGGLIGIGVNAAGTGAHVDNYREVAE